MKHVVFCPDNNYAMPCGVAMVSLLENNTGEDITIHIIGMELTDVNKEPLQQIADKYRTKIVFYNIDKEYLEKFNLAMDGPRYINIAAYVRFFIPCILSSEIDKVLYLDSDLIVASGLEDLWNTSIENYPVAGVQDGLIFYDKHLYERLGYSEQYPYINSGVLLINLKYWRENNVLNKLLDYTKENYEQIVFLDQDVINGALHESILLLPFRFNITSIFYQRDWGSNKYSEAVAEARKNPAIIHYVSENKPWQKGRFHPQTPTFLKYKALSPWVNEPLKWYSPSLSKKFKYYKRIILYKLGLKQPEYIKI